MDLGKNFKYQTKTQSKKMRNLLIRLKFQTIFKKMMSKLMSQVEPVCIRKIYLMHILR